MSKYKFVLAPKVRGFVEWQLERYNEDKKQLEQYKNDMIPSVTASYSPTGGIGGGGTSNPTESIGLKISTNPYILSTERSCRAIERALSHCDDVDMRLIDLIYWKQSYTVAGAGEKVGLTRSPTFARVNKILCRIALEMGLVNI